jgi:hypothetical protein
VVPYSPEHRALAVNEPLLREMVAIAGGAVVAAPAEHFTRERRTARVWVEGWPYLVGLALLLFLPDVALRRFWPHGLWRRGASGVAAAGVDGGRAASPVVGRHGTRGGRR